MADVEILKEKVENIESQRLVKIEKDIECTKKDVMEMKIDLAKNNLLTEQSVETQKNTNETMVAIKDAMLVLANNVEMNNKKQEESSEHINKRFDKFEASTETKFKEINKKIEEEDSKTKFDFILFTKTKIIPSLIGGGLIYLILQIVSKVGV